jgi:hypothetical protein
MCDLFGIPPSQLWDEECPQVFYIWNEIMRQRGHRDRDQRLWTLLIAPLYRSMMSEEGGQQQQDLSQELMEALLDSDETNERREMRNKEAERKLMGVGVNIVRRG